MTTTVILIGWDNDNYRIVPESGGARETGLTGVP